MDDEQIVELYLKRDESAVGVTQQTYGVRLQALAFGIVADRQTAAECENDTYLEAWNSIPPHEPRGYLYAFLARITRHISLNRCRELNRLKRRAHLCQLTAEMEQCIPAPDDASCRLEERELQKALDGYLSTLSREKRTMFLRRYWYLDSISELSERYGLSTSNVKTTLHRIRMGLREYLQKEGYTL